MEEFHSSDSAKHFDEPLMRVRMKLPLPSHFIRENTYVQDASQGKRLETARASKDNKEFMEAAMKSEEKQYIHALFETKNYLELYQVQMEVINEMLSLEGQEDFEDFLESGDLIEEDVFWLYSAAAHGESLLIGGYEGDIAQKTADFLRQQLPEEIYFAIQEHLQNLYVNIDARDSLEEKICSCNQCLEDTGYLLQFIFDDTYSAGAYFLSVISRTGKENG